MHHDSYRTDRAEREMCEPIPIDQKTSFSIIVFKTANKKFTNRLKRVGGWFREVEITS